MYKHTHLCFSGYLKYICFRGIYTLVTVLTKYYKNITPVKWARIETMARDGAFGSEIRFIVIFVNVLSDMTGCIDLLIYDEIFNFQYYTRIHIYNSQLKS